MKKILLPAAAIAAALASWHVYDPREPESPAVADAGNRKFQWPVHFEPLPAAGAYTARGVGYELTLGAQGVRVDLDRAGTRASLALALEGASLGTAHAENALPGHTNYFIGDDPGAWRTGVPHYGRVRYAGVYPGIDLVYHGSEGKLEYDFEVAPGADPARIRMRYGGAQSVRIDDAGNLRVAVAGRELVHHRPVTFQWMDGARRMVESAFQLAREAGVVVVSFQLGDYDTRLPLTIDPVLTYATYLGGTDDIETLTSMVVDAAGALYVAGSTNSDDFPVTGGVLQPAHNGNGTDAFVAKMNPAGTAFEYVTYLGGGGLEESHQLRVDAGGNAYLVGQTTSNDFPVTGGAAQTTFGGIGDVFVAKLNPTGSTLLYATYLGGTGDEPANSVLGGFAIDAAGDAYIYGTTDSVDFPVSANAPQPTRGNPNVGPFDQDAFVTRLNAAGSAFTFSTYLGGTGIEEIDDSSYAGRLMGTDGAGDVWILGTTESADFPATAGAFDTTFNGPAGGNPGGGDLFVARYDTDAGTRSFVTLIGGTGDDFARALQVQGGNAYLAAFTQSNNFPLTAGAPDTTFGGNAGDVALLKLDATGGTLFYSTYLSGGLIDAPNDIRVSAAGALYVAGETRSPDFPATAGAADTTHNGFADGFVARLNAAGTAFDYVTFAGGNEDDTAFFLEIDAAGSAYALLATLSPNAFVTAGGSTHGGDFDDYFVKVNPAGNAFLDASYIGGSLGEGAFATTIDDQENFYFGGFTGSSNYPVTAGVPQTTLAGGAGDQDTFITKLATTPSGPVVQPGTLAFSAATLAVSEAGGNAVLSVTRTGGASGAVSVSCSADAVGGDTASSSDFTVTTVTLNWADGDAAAKTCSIPVTNDADQENAETFTVELGSPTGGATLGAPATAVVTINDDDAPPPPQPGTVQFDPATYSLNENGGSVTLTLTRTAGADGAISVSVASGGGSASAGVDYSPIGLTVSWADGDATSQTVQLALLNDGDDEPNETVMVSLSNPTGGATLGANATVTILDDDVAPTPPPAPVQTSTVRGRYGGSLDVVLLAMLLVALVLSSRARSRATRGFAVDVTGRSHTRRASTAGRGGALLCLVLLVLAPGARADDGWYAGVRAGVAQSTQDATDVENSLAALGHDVTASVEDQQPLFALLGGFQWSNGLAVEASVFSLGEYSVEVTADTASAGDLLADTETVLADGGRGVSTVIAWSFPLGERFSITPRVGGYYWESRRTVTSDAGRIRDREFGVNLTGGLSLDCELDAHWSLGLAWDAWAFAGRNDVHTIGVTLRYRFAE